MEDVAKLREASVNLETLLRKEIDIIARWEVDAEDLDEELDRIDVEKFERLALERNIFREALARLTGSAEEYLAQPEELPGGEETPTTNRKKRDLKNMPAFLTRRHKRRF